MKRMMGGGVSITIGIFLVIATTTITLSRLAALTAAGWITFAALLISETVLAVGCAFVCLRRRKHPLRLDETGMVLVFYCSFALVFLTSMLERLFVAIPFWYGAVQFGIFVLSGMVLFWIRRLGKRLEQEEQQNQSKQTEGKV